MGVIFANQHFLKVASNFEQSLYKLLHNTLYERGINNEFAKELLQMSTTVEHKEYVNFLQDLKGFFSAKFVIRFFIFFAFICPPFCNYMKDFTAKFPLFFLA